MKVKSGVVCFLGIVAIVIGIVLTVLGVADGGFKSVMSKGSLICWECIGFE